MMAKQVIVLNYQEKLKSHHTYKYQKVIKQNKTLFYMLNKQCCLIFKTFQLLPKDT